MAKTVQNIYFLLFLFRAVESGHHADVTFIIDSEKFSAHKCILSARCQYFEEMFHGKWKDLSLITLSQKLVSVFY